MSQITHLISDKSLNHHDLNQRWTLFYCIPNRSGKKEIKWDEFLHVLHSFQSVEDLWALWNSIESPKNLPKGCRYYVFKDNTKKEPIKPLWEDESNLGGRSIEFLYENTKSDSKNEKRSDGGNYAHEAETAFLKIIFTVIGNTSPLKDKINGIEFNNRGNERIRVGIWTSKIEEKEEEEFKKLIKTLNDYTKDRPMEIKDIKLETKTN